MDISKKLLALLAIFCVVVSAGVVCAADYDGGNLGSDYADDMGGYSGSQYEDSGYAGSNYQDDGGWAGSQYNETLENAAANQTAQNTTNATGLAAGEPTNVTDNMTANATSTNTMLATGNPILMLLGVSAILGSAAVLRRRK
ncbi:LPXTG cell wall anchor domain-containing protein [uncultured Methanobrevibacter sp.]|uniref:LPXTG cell wall anchor domain-containing protein n=1 Tax=uncultured Methanobrevibacter sp. TaxID=253161 RepID=UPI0025F1F355|nr:LPXTG cell wall anchor domain-containing protein [uncultured Methanobrevibacter sp.]